MANKKRGLTPLQAEALRIEEEKKRRQDAIKAAQQWALRGSLKQTSAPPAASSKVDEEPRTPDFDQVRLALKDARHSDAKKNAGENPRYVAALDEGGSAAERTAG